MGRALEEARKGLAIYPKNIVQRSNLGLYAMYAGDFETAIREEGAVLEMNPSLVMAYMGTALPQLGEGHPEQAIETYQRLEKISPSGADRKSTRLNSSHRCISYAVFCLKNNNKIPSTHDLI